MSSKNTIYWFRNDLRIQDNEAFSKACKTDFFVYPVFVFDPRLFEPTEIGVPKTGPHRARFLLESVSALKQALRKMGSELVIRVGKPEEVIPVLTSQLQAGRVLASKEVTCEEIEVEKELEENLWVKKVELELIWQSTLFHVDDIPWPIKNLPDVFSSFRKEAEKTVEIRPMVASPEKINSHFPEDFHLGTIPELKDFDLNEKPFDERSVLHFVGGEIYAWNRLQTYIWEEDRLKTYKDTRNGLLGADYSSKLSPWLALGCISAKQVYFEIKRYEEERVKNKSTYWLFFELLWRDYFRFVAKKYGNAIFKPAGIKGEEIHFTENQSLWERWKSGKTGIPFIDANMRELNATGFMSNRGRQNVASFLVKDLNIKWTWGAMYFEHQLIDYDPCSNWGNWNYVAGVGNDPREDRYFNIMSQAKRYDPEGNYVKLWLPELTNLPSTKVHHPAICRPNELSEYSVTIGSDYPEPVVPFKKWVY